MTNNSSGAVLTTATNTVVHQPSESNVAAAAAAVANGGDGVAGHDDGTIVQVTPDKGKPPKVSLLVYYVLKLAGTNLACCGVA